MKEITWHEALLEFMITPSQNKYNFTAKIIIDSDEENIKNFFGYIVNNLKNPKTFQEIEQHSLQLSELYFNNYNNKEGVIVALLGLFPCLYFLETNDYIPEPYKDNLTNIIYISDICKRNDSLKFEENYLLEFGGKALSTLGIYFSTIGQYKDGKTFSKMAVEIYEDLIKKDKKFRNHLAQNLQNLALCQQSTGEFSNAKENFQKVIDIRQKLIEEQSSGYVNNVNYDLLGRLSMNIQNLGLLQFNTKEYLESEQNYNEAIRIRTNLVTLTDNEVYKHDLAITLQNLAILQYEMSRFEESNLNYTKALDYFQSLSFKDKTVVKNDIAMCLQNIALLKIKTKQMDEAKEKLAQATDIREKIAEENPNNPLYLNEYSMTLKNKAIVSEKNNPNEAKNDIEKVIKIRKKLAKENPKAYEISLARTFINYAMVFYNNSAYDDAIQYYNEGIQIFEKVSKENSPIYGGELAQALHLLGTLFYSIKNYDEAEKYYKKAIDILEYFREKRVSFREKLNFAKEYNEIYEWLIRTLTKQGKYQQAISIIEQSKSRAIGDVISNDTFSIKIPKELKDKFKRLQNENYDLIEKLNQEELSNREVIEKEYNYKQLELSRLNEKILEIDFDFLPNIKSLNFQNIIDVVKKSEKCFIYFYTIENGTSISIVYPNGEFEYINISNFTTKYLYNDIAVWLTNYKLSKEMKDLYAFKIVSSEILNKFYKVLLEKVTEKLKAKNVKDIVFIPNKALSILPLHSCWYQKEGKKRYLIDDFNISYTPSITIYKALQDREKKLTDNFSSINIINPKKDLLFSGLEGLKIQGFTKESNNLWHDEAEIKKFIDNSSTDIIHLSCHGSYNMSSPLDSAFAFSDENLTLKEIINSVNLEDNYLTILSACETGMVNFKEQSDEHLGLSIGFLMAKSPTVWGTLWSVNDFSTSLVLIKAYEELIVNKRSKSEALNKAQIWVRDLRVEELLKVLEGYINEIEEKKEEYLQINSGLSSREFDDYLMYWDDVLYKFKELDSDEQIFEHPYYWAGFSCVGIS